MTRDRFLPGWLAAWLVALLLLVPGAAAGRVIANTADARWTAQGASFLTRSNTVSFEVVAAQPPQLETYALRPQQGSEIRFVPSGCGGAPLVIPGGMKDGVPMASVQQTATIRVGEALFFRIVASLANRDSTAIDSMTVTLTTSSGDREVLQVFETAPDSGEFVGGVPTVVTGPVVEQGDCALEAKQGDTIALECWRSGSSRPIATGAVDILADPFGLVFDSSDGTPVNGVRVTLIDAVTGAPARVYADDGVTSYPSSMITGQAVTDSAGRLYVMGPGEYRFPLAPLGHYRLMVEPAAPYSAPSRASPQQLAGLWWPNGHRLAISAASFGQEFALTGPEPVRVDIPLDRPPTPLALSKTASRVSATPGDVVFYTVTVRNPDARAREDVILTDRAARWLRLRRASVRVDGLAVQDGAVQVAGDGAGMTLRLGTLGPGEGRRVTYAMSVRPDAPQGAVENRAEASDSLGALSTASATVRVVADEVSGRMTIIGRLTDGSCGPFAARKGIAGVRVLLEDGSYAVTDADGRYHFDAVVPGTHVVQVDRGSLPEGARLVRCGFGARAAGSAGSRFISSQGGSLVRADFSAELSEVKPANRQQEKIISDRVAAGGETDWLALGNGPVDWLFPAVDHNPRAPAVRVAIRHRPGQTVKLSADGKPVGELAFDGTRIAPDGSFAVSVWRAIPIEGDLLRLSAAVLRADGSLDTELAREVRFSGTAARVELLAAKSRLVADGRTRPVVAVRVLDRVGRPVHAGVSGEFAVSAPYEGAQALDVMQSRVLAGLARAAPQWTVQGDDGVALIELAPTMVSGALKLDFAFADRDVRRRQTLEAWIVPGEQKWTLVGLAEGTAGARTIADNMERTGRFDSDLGRRARVAFYAKGRVLGRFVMTAAYDSARQPDDHRLLGAIDPNAYYTVFADRSDRRFDAASRRKLYLRIESSAFHAMFGDMDTGLDQTQLARYQRVATGVKAQFRSGGFQAQGFAARMTSTSRRDEIQGGGISGPYRLSSRSAVPNSERVMIEVRDRFRSEVVVERREQARFVDYDVDHLAGTITFSRPVQSTDGGLNPQFIVIEYEVDGLAEGRLNAGVRAAWSDREGKVRLGGTAISDAGEDARTGLVGLDAKVRVGSGTELRAEAAASRTAGDAATAWLLEAEHHDGKLDVLAYARSAAGDFGTGALNGAERGRRKIGADARLNLTRAWSVTGSGWLDESLGDASRRQALQLRSDIRTARTDARLGVASFADRLRDGGEARSTVLEAGMTQRLIGNRLELEASTSLPLTRTESIDLPVRHRLAARLAVTPAVRLLGTYEVAEGDAVRARTARAGLEVSPWRGARATVAAGGQQLGEQGRRAFAAFGLAQTLDVTARLTIDVTFDSNRTLSGLDLAGLVNAAHPASSGGYLGEAGTIAEDFTAMTLGAAWRAGRWSATARGEWRDGQLAERRGLTLGAIRQIGEGSMVGSGLAWTRAVAPNGARTEIVDIAVSAAHRPDGAALTFLTRLAFRSDAVRAGVRGEAAGAGRSALVVDGDATARRLVGSFSGNLSPRGSWQRSGIGLFVALRHTFDRYEGYDLAGTSAAIGLDARVGLGERLEAGVVATARHSFADRVTRFAIGPQVGFTPAQDVLLTVGYNVSGFRDRDFSPLRSTDRGLFAALRMKFDADTLGLPGARR